MRHIQSEDLLQRALSLHRCGQFMLAKEYYAQHLQIDPDCPVSRHHLGVIYYEEKDYQSAHDLQADLVREFPENHGYLNNLGNTLIKLGLVDKALELFNQAIALDGSNSEYHVNRSNAHFLLNDLESALSDLNSAISWNATSSTAFANQANVLQAMDRNNEALSSIRKAIEIEKDNAQFHFNEGNILFHCGDYNQAVPAYERAVSLDPALGEAYLGLAKALRKANQADKVMGVLETLYKLQPTSQVVLKLLGDAYLSSHSLDKAKSLFASALENDPSNPVLAYYLASVSEKKPPEKSPLTYVKDLFDLYAQYFNTHLVEGLRYQSPWELREQFCRHHSGKVGHVLDLGCGTGLVGSAFEGLYSTLDGVDISDQMLDVCKSLNIYNQLHHIEIEEFLAQNTNTVDLVVCSDVLIYFGSLNALFHSIHDALKINGYFSFTIETTSQSDYQLNATKRFSHHKSYIERLCQTSGFEILEAMPTDIRFENMSPIKGLNLLVQKIARVGLSLAI